jgi:hypothetical protein
MFSLMPHSTNSPAARRLRFRVSVFAFVLLAFGLLLWARFLLVTNHPRTAIAEPPAPPAAPAQVGSADSQTTP